MSVKLLTEHHLEFLSLKKAAQARLSLHLSKCQTVGNHVAAHFYLLHMQKGTKRSKFWSESSTTSILCTLSGEGSGETAR